MSPAIADALWGVSYFLVTAGLAVYGLHRFCMIALFLRHRGESPKPRLRFAEPPVVTVQLPVFNEYFVVRRLLEAVTALDHPRGRLQIQVLDDSTDATRDLVAGETARLRSEGWDIQHLHRTDRTGFKAGALADGLASARGEYILILDADFVPPPDFLRRTLDYFTDPAVGMVQARWGHLNAEDSLLTRLQAMFLDAHLLIEQTARSRSGRFFNFNGTAGVWRKGCIENAGGWQHDTLTEDLDLSYRAQMAGWQFLYLPDLVVPAELPADINGFRSQQHRWTKGSVQTCLKILPRLWRERHPLTIKVEATAHLTANFAYLLLLAMCVLLLPDSQAATTGWWDSTAATVPVFILTTVSIAAFYLTAQLHLQPRSWARGLLRLPLLLGLGIGMSLNNAKAVLEALLGMQSPFVRTPKTGDTPQGRRPGWRYLAARPALPLLELAFALYFAACVALVLWQNQWMSLPFLLMFLFGFSYVAATSLSPGPAAAAAQTAAGTAEADVAEGVA